MLPISTKKKAKLSDTQSDDTEDAGIRTIYNKYSEEKEEMFSEVEIKQILKMHQELAKTEEEKEMNAAVLLEEEEDFDPFKALNDKLASIS